MKKLLIAAGLISAMVLSGCGGAASTTGSASTSGETADTGSGSNVLKLYNWGEYLGDDVISNFEDEYDAKVIVEYYDSNEMRYTKLQAGDSYDVLGTF